MTPRAARCRRWTLPLARILRLADSPGELCGPVVDPLRVVAASARSQDRELRPADHRRPCKSPFRLNDSDGFVRTGAAGEPPARAPDGARGRWHRRLPGADGCGLPTPRLNCGRLQLRCCAATGPEIAGDVRRRLRKRRDGRRAGGLGDRTCLFCPDRLLRADSVVRRDRWALRPMLRGNQLSWERLVLPDEGSHLRSLSIRDRLWTATSILRSGRQLRAVPRYVQLRITNCRMQPGDQNMHRGLFDGSGLFRRRRASALQHLLRRVIGQCQA